MPMLKVLVIINLSLVCSSKDYVFTIPQCRNRALGFVDNQPVSVTCTGLTANHNIYWSLAAAPSGGDAERRLGDCTACGQRCPSCSVLTTGYSMSRTQSNTTLSFTGSRQLHNGSRIRCSSFNNASQVDCTLNVVNAYTLPSCTKNKVTLTTKQQIITCDGLMPDQSMYWTTSGTNGPEKQVAECGACRTDGSCDCSVTDRDFRVTRTQTAGQLQMVDKARQKDGQTLKCSHGYNVTQASCVIKAEFYSLPQCRGGVVDVLETMNTTILCEGLKNGQNMNWTITDANDGVSRIAWCYSCSVCENKCSIQDDDFVVTRTSTESSLTFISNVRQTAGGILNCSRRDTRRSDECHIRVVYPGVLHQPSVTLHNNWTVSLHAAVDKVFASDSSITCLWNSSRGNQTELLPATNATLSPYTESDGGPRYYRGTCDTLLSLNTSEGSYNFSVEILPGHGPVSLGSALVERPGALTLDTQTCPEYTGEGRDVSCRCSHPSTQGGSPPATLAWPPAADSATLHMEAVKRGQNGTVRTCRSLWGSEGEVVQSLNYTLLVAHGPTGVTVTGPANVTTGVTVTGPANVTDDLQNLTLTCTFTEVYPSANFTWNIPCATLNSTADVSTCTLDGGLLEDGVTAVCLVFNSAVPELNATDSYRFPVTGRAKGDDIPILAVAGGAGAAVAVIVIAIVIAVVVRCRRRADRPSSYKKAADPSTDGVQDHTNNTYENSEDIGVLLSNVHSSSEPSSKPSSPDQPGADHPQAERAANGPQEDQTAGRAAGAPADARDGVHLEESKRSGRDGKNIVSDVYAQVQKKPRGDKLTAESATEAKSPDEDEYVEHINEMYESADDVGVPRSKNDGAPEEGAVYVNSAEAAGGAAGRMETGRRGDGKGDGGADCEAKRVPAVSVLYAQVQKKPRAEQGQGQQDTTQRQQTSETEPTAYANCSSGPTGDNSADLYMNVGESSAPRTDKGVTKASGGGDVYNNLQLVRPDEGEAYEQYSHLGNI